MAAPRNIAKLPQLKHRHLPMDVFDTLPPAVRQALRDAPYNLSLLPSIIDTISYDGGEIAAEIQRIIPILIRDGVLDAYGPDHPQAR